MGNSKYWGPFQRRTPNQGVSTHVFASFHDSITLTSKLSPKYINISRRSNTSLGNNGLYLEDNRVFQPEEVLGWGRDDVDAEKLWKLSEGLVGEKFSY